MSVTSPRPARTARAAQRRRTAEQQRLAYINNFLKANAREIYQYGRRGHRLMGRGYVVVFCSKAAALRANAEVGELVYICDDEVLRLLDAELFERVKNYDARREVIVVGFHGLKYAHVVMSRGRPANRGH